MTRTAPRTALVTGVTGQDGSYLAELLLARGYRVVGTTRRQTDDSPWRSPALRDHLVLARLDLSDAAAVSALLRREMPHEIYHLAAASRVDESWQRPAEALAANAGSTATLLAALRQVCPTARLLVASSCEIFGRAESSPQSETTPIAPSSPYGVSKAAAYWLTDAYRRSHGLFAVSAILYNHESPRRSVEFVTRKITRAVARIIGGLDRQLILGNLDGRRDWGFAGDYVEALWRMLQLDHPSDLVLGTGRAHSVRDFCECAFALVGLDYRQFVVEDTALHRPADSTSMVADARRARQLLSWEPTVQFPQLVEMMVSADRERLQRGELV